MRYGQLILDVLCRHKVQSQLWVTGSGEAAPTAQGQQARVAAEAQRIGLIARAANGIGGTVGLYNHGGWFGEPTNQVAIIEKLRTGGITNVGIVYNQHHGHDQVERFGMARDGDRQGKKIMVIGQGELDRQLLTILQPSGWHGPIGILNHTDEDAEQRLRDNLDGLERLTIDLQGKPSR